MPHESVSWAFHKRVPNKLAYIDTEPTYPLRFHFSLCTLSHSFISSNHNSPPEAYHPTTLQAAASGTTKGIRAKAYHIFEIKYRWLRGTPESNLTPSELLHSRLRLRNFPLGWRLSRSSSNFNVFISNLLNIFVIYGAIFCVKLSAINWLINYPIIANQIRTHQLMFVSEMRHFICFPLDTAPSSSHCREITPFSL